MDVTVIGAGPAGLAAGLECLRLGAKCQIIEASDNPGGMGRTYWCDGYGFDEGPHRFFTKNSDVLHLWKSTLARDFFCVPRQTRILREGKYYDYPIRMTNILSNIGICEVARIVSSWISARVLPIDESESFANWVTAQFGERIYESFFRDYTEKVWGIPCTEISAQWAAQRIKGMSALAIARSLFLSGERPKSMVAEFWYPRYGSGQMYDEMARTFIRRGGVIAYDSPCTEISLDEPTISTMPLDAFMRLVRGPTHDARYRAHLTVNLILDRPCPFRDNWIYVHDREIGAARMTNPESFSPYLVAGNGSVGVEYFCDAGDELWRLADADLKGRAIADVRSLPNARTVRATNGFVVRSALAYPVYTPASEAWIDNVRAWLLPRNNLQVAGRAGLFRYNNMDHSLYTGILAARNIVSGAGYDVWSVNSDAEYHEGGR